MQQKINYHGWLVIDKPTDITSAKLVAKVKYLTKAKKNGHAGTLDPLATGLLPLCFGEATKTMQYLMNRTKSYNFTIRFGEQTDTDDSEGNIIHTSTDIPTKKDIIKILPEFLGEIEQIPPAYSAIKVSGKRSYTLARQGNAKPLKARKVTISSLSVLEHISATDFTFSITCSKGTYIRAIARDLALKLRTYGHICALRRTQIGKFSEKNAISLEKLEQLVHNAPLFEKSLLPVETALDDIPVLKVSPDSSKQLRFGQSISWPNQDIVEIAGATCDGKIIAIGQVNKNIFKPVRVFNY